MQKKMKGLCGVAAMLLAAVVSAEPWTGKPLPSGVKASMIGGGIPKVNRLGVWNIWPNRTKVAVKDVWNGPLPVRFEVHFTPADNFPSWLDGRFFSLFDADGREILTVDAVRRGRFRLRFAGKSVLSLPVVWETAVVHWGRLAPDVVTIFINRDRAAVAFRGETIAEVAGKVSPKLPLRAELGARDSADHGFYGWYTDLLSSAGTETLPPTAKLPGKAEFAARVMALEKFIYQDKDYSADRPTFGQVDYHQARRAALRLAVDSLWFRLAKKKEPCFELMLEQSEKLAEEIRSGKQPNRVWKFNDAKRGKHFLAPDDDDFYGGVCGWSLGSRAPEFAMMGINLVSEHVWPGAVMDGRGNFDSGMLIRSTMPGLEETAKNHIRFDLMVAPYIPGFLLSKHPEWDGTFVGFGVENEAELLSLHEKEWKGRQAGHGWLKASVIHPDFRKVCETFLAGALPILAQNKAVVAIDLANEIQFEDYTPAMQARFRAWLLKKYGSLDAVNRAWGTKYTKIDQILMVRPLVHDRRNQARFWDWNLFNREQGTEFFTFMKNLCEKYAPGIPTHIKHLPYEFGVPWIPAGRPEHNFYDYADGIDRLNLARLTPIIGTDSWADNGHDRYGRLSSDAPYQTAYLSLLGNFAPEKRIFDSEWHILRCDPPITAPDCLDMIMKQNVTCNLKAGTAWVCAPGINQKLDISSTPYVMLQLGLTTADIRQKIALYDAAARRDRPVGIFYSPHSRYLDSVRHVKALLNLSEGAMFSGLSFRVIDERQFKNGEIDPKTVPLLLVPDCPIPDQADEKCLADYVKAGGKVVFGGSFGKMSGAEAAKRFGGESAVFPGDPKAIPALLRTIAQKQSLYPRFEVVDGSGRLVYGIQWQTARTADGKTVLYVANMSKAPQKLVVRNAKKLTDGNTGKSRDAVLELKIHDTFIGFVE